MRLAASLWDVPRLVARFISVGLFRSVRHASFSGLWRALSRLETQGCALKLPVMRQIFAEGDEACPCKRLRLAPFKEVSDDARRQIREAHVRRKIVPLDAEPQRERVDGCIASRH